MFFVFMALWLLFNSRVTLELLLFGAVISAVCCLLCKALFGWSLSKDAEAARKFPKAVRLFGTLLAEIWKANMAVIKAVYSRKSPEPAYVRFNPSLESESARSVLADCITLTPGTITGILDESGFTVHCLDKSMAEGIEDSSFVRQLQKFEKERDKGEL